jgi:hypothetical protein
MHGIARDQKQCKEKTKKQIMSSNILRGEKDPYLKVTLSTARCHVFIMFRPE